MADNRKNLFDRRSGNDRRRVYKLGYFISGGIERRRTMDRRHYVERRKGWVYVEDCCSIMLENQNQIH